MVRVGREEAMHPEAANICSQQLAKRDVARINSEQPTAPSGLNEEVREQYKYFGVVIFSPQSFISLE